MKKILIKNILAKKMADFTEGTAKEGCHSCHACTACHGYCRY